MEASKSKVLFICTGNYYRSRFAESYFNHWAAIRKIDWEAESRGLRIDNPQNVGPISPFALEALKKAEVKIIEPFPGPKALIEIDLETADCIIALKEEEHRTMLEAQFPEWLEEVDFWHINDIDVEAPADAMEHLEEVLYDFMDMLHMRDWKAPDQEG